VETYLRFAEAIALTGTSSRPIAAPPPNTTEMDRILAENAELRRKLDELS
jgi:hypothetical protein